MTPPRATYATVYVGTELDPDHRLDLEWATHAADETDRFEFEVVGADPHDAIVGVQAFDVGAYGHEIRVNGEALTGFDIPPNDGWQYWVDTVTGAELRQGTNTLQIARDTATDDAFAIGTVVVQWKESDE